MCCQLLFECVSLPTTRLLYALNEHNRMTKAPWLKARCTAKRLDMRGLALYLRGELLVLARRIRHACHSMAICQRYKLERRLRVSTRTTCDNQQPAEQVCAKATWMRLEHPQSFQCPNKCTPIWSRSEKPTTMLPYSRGTLMNPLMNPIDARPPNSKGLGRAPGC